MIILISGGNGLIGTRLTKKLIEKGHEVRLLVRKKSEQNNAFFWDYKNKIIENGTLDKVDCIIHLAGANIGKRWTNRYKKEIISSRTETAQFLLEKCVENNISLQSFISASGINYYGTFTSNRVLNEDDSILQKDFLAEVCELWEKSAIDFGSVARRIVILRTALVLAENGGSFGKLKTVADWHLASGIGNGAQWFNWIHIEDMVNLYVEAVENTKMNGIYNAVADEIPTQKSFMKALAKENKTLFFPINVPAFVMKIAFGEMSEIILKGSKISNEKIKSLGFKLKFPNVKSALGNLINLK